jgi:hypothetical protein
MPQLANIRQFIIEWNNTFIYDREYRKSHQMAFNSPSHRSTCQIDIFLEHLEAKVFEEHQENYIQNRHKEDKYKKGE